MDGPDDASDAASFGLGRGWWLLGSLALTGLAGRSAVGLDLPLARDRLEDQLMRTVRTLMTAAVLAGAGLLGVAGTAVADSPSPSASAERRRGRGGTPLRPRRAPPSVRRPPSSRTSRPRPDASTGDYLYWVLPVDAGQRATVKAKVTLPAGVPGTARPPGSSMSTTGCAAARRACTARRPGPRPRTPGSVELSCTLRTVRAWAEPWSNDPLPGSYYVRLTVVDLPQEDLGLPVRAEVDATVADTGGAHAVDGTLAAPLVPGAATAAPQAEESTAPGAACGPAASRTAAGPPAGGPTAGLWTAAGGLLAALAGIAGYRFTRGAGRPSQVPPGA